MPKISQDEIFGYLQKARLVSSSGKDNGSPLGIATPGPYAEGMPATAPKGVEPIHSVLLNPATRYWGSGGKNKLQPNKHVEYQVLRRIAEKAWLINTIITHQQNKIRPFLKPSTDKNIRGFHLTLKDQEHAPTPAQKVKLAQVQRFMLQTGWEKDPERQDDLVHFGMKAVRDYLTIDQLTTEMQNRINGTPFAFWAIDPATISRCIEREYTGDDAVRFVQEVDQIPVTYYTDDDLIFDYGNPRSDIDHSGYGYSLTEQAIDLITAQINSFWYNASSMTEDNLPRGMILLNGDSDLETVEAIEEFVSDTMSAGPQGKWRIPIVPAGATGGEGGKSSMEWVSFRANNRDMEFIEWTDHLWASVGALFGVDLEEVGIHLRTGGAVLGDNVTPRIEESKQRGESAILSFLESHFQKIVEKLEDWIDFEFVGYERYDPKAESELLESELRTFRSIDDICKAKDMKPYKQPWSIIPLNPSVVQMVMAAQAQAAQQAMGAQAQGQGQPQGAPGQGPEGDDGYKKMAFGDDDEGGKGQAASNDDDDGWGAVPKENEAEEPQEPKEPGDDRGGQVQKSIIEITI